MENVLKEIAPLSTKEKKALRKIMRQEHGSATSLAETLNIQRTGLYKALDGGGSPAVRLTIRKFLNAQKVA